MKSFSTVAILFIFLFRVHELYADTIFLPESAEKRVLVPTSDIGQTWRAALGYADSDWMICSGAPGGVGYEQSSGYENLITLDVGNLMHEGSSNPNSSCYIRIKFEITNDMLGNINRLNLNVRYDDGFIAWLNGVEVARMNTDGVIMWNSVSSGSHDTNGKETFNITDNVDNLKSGTNLLAIQGLNTNPSSSDFLINAEIVATEDPFTDFTFSNLPLVFIETNGQNIRDEPKIDAMMRIVYHGIGNTHYRNEPANDYDGHIGIEWRGSSSQSWSKKQYAVETRDENGNNNNVSLMGLPEENDWVLNAPFLDRSFMRNVLSYDLSRRLGHYASRTQYCELFLNGEYQGIYVLMEKIKRDKDRVDVAEMDSGSLDGDAVTGGYILKIDKTAGSSNDGFTSRHLPAGESTRRIVYQYHYPDPDEILSQQKNYIRNYMFAFEDMMASENYNDPQTGYPAWIDVESFIDFFLVSEIGKNVDSYRLSSYLYKERDSDGGLLYAGPVWDYNLAFGLANYYDGEDTDEWMLETLLYIGGTDWQVPFWWETLLNDPQFNSQIKQRWFSLRKSVFSLERIHAFIDNVAYDLRDAQARNFAIWPAPGEPGEGFWPMPGVFYSFTTYQDEVDYMKWWIEERIEWMDENVPLFSGVDDNKIKELPNEVVLFQNYPNPFNPTTQIQFELMTPADVELKIFNSSGQLVRSLSQSLPTGLKSLMWDGSDDSHQPVAGGVYICQLTVHTNENSWSQSKKMLLLK